MPYISNSAAEIKQMLKAIGVNSPEELYSHIPNDIKLTGCLNIPSGLSEYDVKKYIKSISEKNRTVDEFNSFLGAGCYDHYVPAALAHILRSQFLTAYTPYQPECSQGILQAIYEYQSYMCLLTGMDISNASLFDGASAAAEAVLMALRITHRSKIIVCGLIHPEYRQTLGTYLSGFDFTVQEIEEGFDGLVDTKILGSIVDENTACCLFQSPDFFGLVENIKEIVECSKRVGALAVMITNPLSLALLKEPGKLGVDIVCGDGQPLGGFLNFGGPAFGFLTTRSEYLRQMPGRIAGKTLDKDGNSAYCLTLATREQHIKREKATSNICSNQSLNAIGAAIYLSLMGKQGIKDIAAYSFSNAQYLYQRLSNLRGVKLPFTARFFNEFIWETEDPSKVMSRLYQKNIIAGYYVGEIFPRYKNCILSCCTEKKTKKDIDAFVVAIAEVLRE